MGKLVVTEFITLDGVFEDPGGAESFDLGGWAFRFERGPEGDRFKLDELMAADAQLLGRVTYEGFAAAWPKMGDSPFGEKMNSMPKFVVSSTLQDASWNNSTIITGDLASEVSAVKDRFTGDVLVAGSGQLVRGLLDAGLVDQLRLMIFPTILGRGKQLFAGARSTALRPVEVGRAGATTTVVLEASE
jgi:dihydrofolate reductase